MSHPRAPKQTEKRLCLRIIALVSARNSITLEKVGPPHSREACHVRMSSKSGAQSEQCRFTFDRSFRGLYETL